MSKWKGYALLALILFLIAYRPDTAAVIAAWLGGFAVDLADGAGTIVVNLAGGGQ